MSKILHEQLYGELDNLEKEFSKEYDSMLNIDKDLYDLKSSQNNVTLLIDGLKSAQQLVFLFSPGLNALIEQIINSIETGDFIAQLKDINNIKAMVNKTAGFLLGSANNVTINNRIIDTIYRTTTDPKFKRIKSNMLQVIKLIRNLKHEKKFFSSKEEQMQYDQMVNMLIDLIKIVKNIMKNRNIVVAEMKKAKSGIYNESSNIPKLIAIFE